MGKPSESRAPAPVVDIAGRGRMRGLDRAFDILDVLREHAPQYYENTEES